MLKRKQPQGGCQFCNDEDFARRHMREDEILNEIATLANELVREYHATASHSLKQKLDRISLMLQQFKELDNEMEQVKQAAKSLKVIEEELSAG